MNYQIPEQIEKLTKLNVTKKGNKWYINNKLVPYDKINEKLGSDIQLKAYEKYLEYNNTYEKNTDYDAAMALNVECYHGKFYKDGKTMTDLEVIELIHNQNNEFSFAQIQSTMKAATILKRIDRLPDFIFPDVEPKGAEYSDGKYFRFNKTVYQLIKYYLYSSRQDYILFIMSDGGQGKSTLTNFLKQLFKNEYYSADTKFMNQFSTASWASSRLVCFSDCTNKFIDNSHILKQISGGDDIQIEAKGVQGYSGKIDCNLLFIGNEPLSYNIMDTGMQRRFINLPWEQNLKYKDPKWVDYEWSLEEIAWHLEQAKHVEDFDFDTLQKQTIKDSLHRKSAFYYNNYSVYKTNEDMAYNRENFDLFWKLVMKYYSEKEWSEVLKGKSEVTYYEIETVKGDND